MPVSLQAQPTSFKLAWLTKGTYFTWNEDLYYVIDVKLDDDVYLIENCKSLDNRWVTGAILGDMEEGMAVIRKGGLNARNSH